MTSAVTSAAGPGSPKMYPVSAAWPVSNAFSTPAEPGFGVGHDRRELHEAGTTIVVITHDQHIGAAMPQRVGCALSPTYMLKTNPSGKEERTT